MDINLQNLCLNIQFVGVVQMSLLSFFQCELENGAKKEINFPFINLSISDGGCFLISTKEEKFRSNKRTDKLVLSTVVNGE